MDSKFNKIRKRITRKIKTQLQKQVEKQNQKKIQKQRKIQERIKKIEAKKGRQLTEEEKQRIERKIKLKQRREKFIRGGFLALGITLGAGGHALATSGDKADDNDSKQKIEMQADEAERPVDDVEMQIDDAKNAEKVDNKETKTKNVYKDTLKINQNISPCINHESVDYEQIIDAYNKKYDTDLTAEDISFIKSNPQFLGISEDGKYIQDYKEDTPVEEYIDDNIEDVYIMINNKDNTIISSLGKVDGEIKNIDTKVVMTYEGDEFFESYQKIDLTNITVKKGKKTNQSEAIYNTLKNQYEKQYGEQTKEIEER